MVPCLDGREPCAVSTAQSHAPPNIKHHCVTCSPFCIVRYAVWCVCVPLCSLLCGMRAPCLPAMWCVPLLRALLNGVCAPSVYGAQGLGKTATVIAYLQCLM